MSITRRHQCEVRIYRRVRDRFATAGRCRR